MYLSKIIIHNYKGIEDLEVSFSPKVNIIIGENSSCKSALIDAIRLLYNLGEPIRDISVAKEDFFEKVIQAVDKEPVIEKSTSIKISYEFRDLSIQQKGAFYEYMVVDHEHLGNDYAKIEIQYKDDDKKYPQFSYTTGEIDGQKADSNTFQLFQHYYLSAIRDSTKDLLNVRNNILGKVIKRLVERNEAEDEIKKIFKDANDELLKRPEVTSTRDNINKNLSNIFKNTDNSSIGLHIEQSRIEYIVNVIKPYLPYDLKFESADGFQLWQNSLGYNNLIYIATVLGDIKERAEDDPIPHYALLIEEPEAHIHPQLQLSLYNFLKDANDSANSQLFITTHSPTLTSKVPFENLILLDKGAYLISNSFSERENDKIIQDTVKNLYLKQIDIDYKKAQLQRYIDVTKSQLFFAKSILFGEGITEELLISAFALIENFKLEDYRIELVNVNGISFYPFLFLFNSPLKSKRLPKKIAVLTDDDRFSDSKKPEYKIDRLIDGSYQVLEELHKAFAGGSVCNRVNNLKSVCNNQTEIIIKSSFQTLEYDLCRSNICENKKACEENILFKFINTNYHEEAGLITNYWQALPETLIDEQQEKLSLLLWKCLPKKADFAQNFSLYIINNIVEARKTLKVPQYIKEAFSHLQS